MKNFSLMGTLAVCAYLLTGCGSTSSNSTNSKKEPSTNSVQQSLDQLKGQVSRTSPLVETESDSILLFTSYCRQALKRIPNGSWVGVASKKRGSEDYAFEVFDSYGLGETRALGTIHLESRQLTEPMPDRGNIEYSCSFKINQKLNRGYEDLGDDIGNTFYHLTNTCRPQLMQMPQGSWVGFTEKADDSEEYIFGVFSQIAFETDLSGIIHYKDSLNNGPNCEFIK